MVDRYLLPVPKTKNSRMYVRFPQQRKRVAGGMFLLSFLTMAFQINRYLSMKIVIFIFYKILIISSFLNEIICFRIFSRSMFLFCSLK